MKSKITRELLNKPLGKLSSEEIRLLFEYLKEKLEEVEKDEKD